jgi:hypothetical protein
MMKTVLGLALLASTFVAGCGCDPGNNAQRAPVVFQPSSTDATRSSCGTITLKLLGETDIAPPYTLIQVDVGASATVGQEIPLWVDTPASNVSAQSSDGVVRFSYQTGSNAYELDANPLSSVVVTVDALPSADGTPVKIGLRMTFEDGRVLDDVYSAPVQSTQAPCGI